MDVSARLIVNRAAFKTREDVVAWSARSGGQWPALPLAEE